jgi:vacuolar-type H+-ATPase subunit I/STV1
MKFKRDAEGKLVLDDHGNPILVDDDGKELALDALAPVKEGDDKKVVSLGKYERVEGERDEYKKQLTTLQGEVEGLKTSAGDADALKSKVEELTSGTAKLTEEFDAKMAARDKEHALDTALLGAGVKPAALKAAKAYVDLDTLKLEGEALSGLDLETFKKDQAFLFAPVTKVATGAPSRGGAGDEIASTIRDGVEAEFPEE